MLRSRRSRCRGPTTCGSVSSPRSAAGRGRGCPCVLRGTASPARGPSDNARAILRARGVGRGAAQRPRSSPSRSATDRAARARPEPATPDPSSTPAQDEEPGSQRNPSFHRPARSPHRLHRQPTSRNDVWHPVHQPLSVPNEPEHPAERARLRSASAPPNLAHLLNAHDYPHSSLVRYVEGG
jgi:hypothetical protein